MWVLCGFGMFEALKATGFDLNARNHAAAILATDFGEQVERLIASLLEFRIDARDIVKSGGGHAASTMRLRDRLYSEGWRKHVFEIQTIVDGDEREARTHEIDHVLRAGEGTLALEIEWNNKDPFFDRDLENFQRLHAQGAISVGILITRGQSLQEGLQGIVEATLRDAGIVNVDELVEWGVKRRTERQMEMLEGLMERQVPFAEAFAKSFVADKFGAATTHWAKLEERVVRGVGNPCPLLLIGLPREIVRGYSAAIPEL